MRKSNDIYHSTHIYMYIYTYIRTYLKYLVMTLVLDNYARIRKEKKREKCREGENR